MTDSAGDWHGPVKVVTDRRRIPASGRYVDPPARDSNRRNLYLSPRIEYYDSVSDGINEFWYQQAQNTIARLKQTCPLVITKISLRDPNARRILVLANSYKNSGRCVAGIEITSNGFGNWIRPVSTRPTHEVSVAEQRYVDGSDTQVLDIVDIPLLDHKPQKWQQENWILNPASRWIRHDTATLSDLDTLSVDSRPLWLSGYHSQNGKNDRIPVDVVGDVMDSLRFIHTILTIKVSYNIFTRNNDVRAIFTHAQTEYNLKITDPRVIAAYSTPGQYSIGSCFLTISLAPLYNGYAYKLVAAVIDDSSLRPF